MRYFLLFVITWSISPTLSAQKHLEGLWEGIMTRGGIDSEEGYKFELLLKLEGQYIKGRSYLYLSENEIIEMDIRGVIYQDRSAYLQDVEFIPLEEDISVLPPFYRKYQFIYNRSVFGSKLEGYWQQMLIHPFDGNRQRGRILLKKKVETKA
jgi:hypothetical protein